MGEVYFRNKKDGLTIEQKKYIIENYRNEKTSKIAKKLNISYKSIRNYAGNNGITKYKKSFEDYVKEKEEFGSCKKYTCLTEENKEEKLYKSKYGKYYVNENYFNIIDTEFKAYWFGFLLADGYVSEKTPCVELTLCQQDKAHLVKFLNSLQSNSPIRDKVVKQYFASRATICNKNIVQQLVNKGCVNNKSLIIEMPNYDVIPKKLYRHFIRGFFDGDGCIYLNSQTKKISVSFTSNIHFIKQLIEYLSNELDMTKTAINYKKDNNAVGCQWRGVDNCYKIFNYMYRDSNIYLDRKFNKFDNIFCLN